MIILMTYYLLVNVAFARGTIAALPTCNVRKL